MKRAKNDMNSFQINTAATSDSITIYWEKDRTWPRNARYAVWLDGKLADVTEKTHYTWENLKENQKYSIRVECTDENRAILVSAAEVAASTAKRKNRIDVTQAPYHAKGDGTTLNTAVLQQAMDDCTEADEIYFPAGTYLTGALRLHSDMTVYLEEGATLQGTARVEDYCPKIPSRFEGYEMECYSSLLNLGDLDHNADYNCRSVLIHGKGTIASGGRELAEAVIAQERIRLEDYMKSLGSQLAEYEKADTLPGRVRPRLINMSNCQNIRISGLTLAHGACWNVHMIYSDQIVTDHCTFRSENVWNGDGWDPDSSTNCTIFACRFYTGDDSIAIKSGKNPEGNVINRPCEHIRIFDCSCAYGHGFTIGSEMSGGVNDVRIWDCDLSSGLYGVEIKGTKKRGGYVRNVHVLDCILPRVLFHSVGYNDDGIGAPVPPVFESCSFTRSKLLGTYMDKQGEKHDCTAIELCGFDEPGHEIRDIRFEEITLPAGHEQLISLKYCKDISFEKISVE